MNKIVLYSQDLQPLVILHARGTLAPEALHRLGSSMRCIEREWAVEEVPPTNLSPLLARPLRFIDLGILPIRNRTHLTYVLVCDNDYSDAAVRRICAESPKYIVPVDQHVAVTLGLYS